MACALLTGRADLDERLGGDFAHLRALLVRMAQDWAAAVAPDRPARLVGHAEVAAAARASFAAGAAPLLIASADTPRLTPAHARMALGDLEAGADASFGPGMDGGCYLVALARPEPVLLDLLMDAIDGHDVMNRVFATAHTGGLDIGMLRMERLLRTRRDAAALRVDPLTPQPVRAALAEMG